MADKEQIIRGLFSTGVIIKDTTHKSSKNMDLIASMFSSFQSKLVHLIQCVL